MRPELEARLGPGGTAAILAALRSSKRFLVEVVPDAHGRVLEVAVRMVEAPKVTRARSGAVQEP